MKKLNIVYLIALMICTSLVQAKSSLESTSDSKIQWNSIDNAVAQSKSNNKPFIFVEIYTDWCGWCKKMEETTLEDEGILDNLNSNFTTVKLNAEAKTPVTFKGQTYNFVKTGNRGANQLALNLGSVGGRLGYPTIVVLDADGNKLQAFPGFKDTETMNVILNYYKSGSYKTMDFQQFQSTQ
ncbi:MAG: DUF255 domain-containing protein [Chitinophagales bacterium]|nr:DUF255 domain-containing protein [Bacteroidota bacterium]